MNENYKLNFTQDEILKAIRPNIDFSGLNGKVEDNLRIVAKAQEEKRKRDIENNENLKSVAEYNKELVQLNNKFLNKLNSLEDILVLFSQATDINMKKTQDKINDNNALLLEMIGIIEAKDEKKLSQFLLSTGSALAMELMISFLKMKLGLTV